MTTRGEASRLNGKKGGRPRKLKTRVFPDLDSFPWRTHESIPEQTQDQQYGEFLSVECIRRGRWRSVWIQKPVQLADTEPRNGKGI
jgi:hypothetical protein